MMSNQSYFSRATMPRQYDSKDVNWEEEGNGDDSIRRMLLEITMKEAPKPTTHPNHLDLGCGTGWLTNALTNLGFHSIGLDASADNITGARKHYKNGVFINKDFVNEPIDGTYDFATALMSLEHAPDAVKMLTKIAGVMNEGGRFVLIYGDYDYFTQPRFDVDVSIEKSSLKGQVATCTHYGGNFGTLYDVIRRPYVYQSAAETAGLTVVANISAAVPKWLVDERPEYEVQLNVPMFQVLVAEKSIRKL